MKMRQILLISILSFAMIVSLTGCIIIPRHMNYEIDADDVSSVEIYDLRSSETHDSGFHKSETPVYTVEDDQITDFLSDLAEIQFTDTIVITIAAVDPSFYYGDWVVRINHTDGSYSLISCRGYGETCDENDQRTSSNHYGCEDDEWEQLIGNYVPADIFGE